MNNTSIRKFALYLYYVICIIKLFLAYIVLHLLMKKLLQRDIWIVREKRTEARDNGFHLYKYITTNHPEIEVYYVITKNSSDYQKVKSLGKIVRASSFMHYILWLSAKYSISSQQNGAVPDPTDVLYRYKWLCNKNQKVIFIRHGIQKDEMSHDFDYKKTRFSLVTCTAQREYDFIKKTYGYPNDKIKITGLCRFDNLSLIGGNTNKIILIMPTFRSWLAAQNREKEATDIEKQNFIKSPFYTAYSSVLSDNALLCKMRETGYKLVFYMHYSFQSFVPCFERFSNDSVTIATRQQYDVQQLLIESSILVTDYSSIFFDFAYMSKTEVFYQFDEEEYRKKHYQKGYFEYRTDGFGPVITDHKQLISWLNDCIDRNARIEDKYVERINNFFTFRDNHNCERVYNAIVEMI